MSADTPAFERLVAGLAQARLTHWVPKILHMHVAWCFGLENSPPLTKTPPESGEETRRLPPQFGPQDFGNRHQRRARAYRKR